MARREGEKVERQGERYGERKRARGGKSRRGKEREREREKEERRRMVREVSLRSYIFSRRSVYVPTRAHLDEHCRRKRSSCSIIHRLRLASGTRGDDSNER